jgi:hypothetical protein
VCVNRNDLEYLSDVNLILFFRDEFVAIYNGESEYYALPNGVRATAVRQGLLTKHSYPSRQRLTDKTINIMREHDLILED